MLDNVAAVREADAAGDLLFGTIDTWVIYKLTHHAAFVTDVTNASRTMFMNIHTLQWDDELLKFFGVSRSSLPEIRSSSEVYLTRRKQEIEEHGISCSWA